MAANYVLLERIELNASAASVTFSNIPQSGYTDLKIVYSARSNDSVNGWNLTRVQFNTDTTAANYNYRVLGGFGSTAYSGYGTQAVGYTTAAGRTANTFGNGEIYIPNYLGSTQKSYSGDSVTEGNGSTYEILGFHATLWSGTSAINQIILSLDNSASFVQYSTFSLYGLAAVGTTPVIAPKASGGNIQTDGTYWYHTFLTTGAFVPATNLTCDYLVVAGGGGGGGTSQDGAGGGGAGGLRSTVGATGGGGSLESAVSLTAGSYTVTVGAGGAGAGSSATNGSNGSNSVFNTITSIGGGGGSRTATVALVGGSGGGGWAGVTGTGNAGGLGTANQGYAGGAAQGTASPYAGGGGGGAGAAGVSGASGGTGGAGVAISAFANATSTGVSTYYAGGGGSGRQGSGVSAGGAGGGGTGGNPSTPSNGVAGTTNTGGGGGGGGAASTQGAAGGSGIVIIRYPIA